MNYKIIDSIDFFSGDSVSDLGFRYTKKLNSFTAKVIENPSKYKLRNYCDIQKINNVECSNINIILVEVIRDDTE